LIDPVARSPAAAIAVQQRLHPLPHRGTGQGPVLSKPALDARLRLN
jgi:hypothetical protein